MQRVGFKGRLKLQVMQGSRVIAERPWQKNLILDQGLDAWATRRTADLFAYCVAGTGDTAPAVEQAGLVSEVKRTNTYITASGGCGHSIADSVVTLKRTFSFSQEVSAATYSEIGFSWAGDAGDNLFSRVLLNSPVSLVAGQRLRVIYELLITCSPTSPSALTADIPGWPVSPASGTDATQQWQNLGLWVVASTGLGAAYNGGALVNEPSETVAIFASPSSDALGTFAEEGPDRSTDADYAEATATYTPGSFELLKAAVLTGDQANRSDLRTIGVCATTGPTAANVGFAVLFEEAQTKEEEYTLALGFNYEWGRTV